MYSANSLQPEHMYQSARVDRSSNKKMNVYRESSIVLVSGGTASAISGRCRESGDFSEHRNLIVLNVLPTTFAVPNTTKKAAGVDAVVDFGHSRSSLFGTLSSSLSSCSLISL